MSASLDIHLTIPEVAALPEQTIQPVVTFTDAALRQVRRVLAKKLHAEPNTFVRVGVKGGGCSGMSYLMELDTEFDESDRTWIAGGNVRVVVDDRSLAFIDGMTIDYTVKNLMEGGFIYSNPNAARSCGCGTSFTPK